MTAKHQIWFALSRASPAPAYAVISSSSCRIRQTSYFPRIVDAAVCYKLKSPRNKTRTSPSRHRGRISGSRNDGGSKFPILARISDAVPLQTKWPEVQASTNVRTLLKVEVEGFAFCDASLAACEEPHDHSTFASQHHFQPSPCSELQPLHLMSTWGC